MSSVIKEASVRAGRGLLPLVVPAVLATCVLALFGWSWMSSVRKANCTVLKLAHGLDASHPVHKAMLLMADRVKDQSQGRMLIEVFPSGQLGSERECIEQLQLGCMDMTKTSAGPLESFVPSMAVFSLPFVFRDSVHFWKVLEGPIGKRFLLESEAKGMRGLCYYDSGARSFYTTKKPALTPKDIAGLKIRVMQSKTSMDMVKSLGASPTPIAWGELYTALQQGVIDGAENNPPSVFTARHYEVCKHYVLDEHTRIPDILLISKVVWDKLAPEDQRIVQDAANESMAFQRTLWECETTNVLAQMKALGLNVYTPDKKIFVDTVQPLFEKLNGTEIGSLVKAIGEVK